jgi:hypothetical protein
VLYIGLVRAVYIKLARNLPAPYYQTKKQDEKEEEEKVHLVLLFHYTYCVLNVLCDSVLYLVESSFIQLQVIDTRSRKQVLGVHFSSSSPSCILPKDMPNIDLAKQHGSRKWSVVNLTLMVGGRRRYDRLNPCGLEKGSRTESLSPGSRGLADGGGGSFLMRRFCARQVAWIARSSRCKCCAATSIRAAGCGVVS